MVPPTGTSSQQTHHLPRTSTYHPRQAAPLGSFLLIFHVIIKRRSRYDTFFTTQLEQILRGIFKEAIFGPLKFKMADGRHFLKSFFGHNSAADCQISVRFSV